jgi:hypothetical protein
VITRWLHSPRTPSAVEDNLARYPLHRAPSLGGAGPVTMSAIAAADMALWDIAWSRPTEACRSTSYLGGSDQRGKGSPLDGHASAEATWTGTAEDSTSSST